MKIAKVLFALCLIFILPRMIFCQIDEAEENEQACGVERWAIKTFTDPDTVQINFNNIVNSTIAFQKTIAPPPDIINWPPRQSTETTVYRIEGYLIFHKLESDQDIHLGFMSMNHLDTMIAEICDPTCPGIINTSRYQQLKTVRDWFVATYNPIPSFQTFLIHVSLVGVGFFDLLHGQRGIPPNGREIHSVLSISLITGVGPNNEIIPAEYKLSQNYPNPFNPETKINFDVPIRSYVSLKVYNIYGYEVATLQGGVLEAGQYSKNFNAGNLSSGTYFYKLTTDNFTATKKMVVVK